jgi:predicted RNA-binding Zn ribbon-like protein
VSGVKTVKQNLVIDFVNTAGLDPEREDLATPGALLAWLDEHGLEPGARATRADLEEVRRVREALRDLMRAHNGCGGDVTAALATIDDAACRAHLGVRFVEDGRTRIEPRNPGIRGAVGRILAEVSQAIADGTWERMKACRADDCKHAFYDAAKNRSRAWCSMRVCGNRAKVQHYRERHST